MAPAIRASATIQRPVEDVFRYVLDLESNGPEWAPDLESVAKATEGPIGAGTTFDQRQKVMGIRRTTKLTFTAVEPNSKIEVEADLGPIAPTMTASFEPAGEGTLVTFEGDPNPKGPFKLLAPLVAKQGQRMWDARVTQLKTVLERSTA